MDTKIEYKDYGKMSKDMSRPRTLSIDVLTVTYQCPLESFYAMDINLVVTPNS